MRCPNCSKEMKSKSYIKIESFYDWEDGERYFHKVRHTKDVCDDCKIVCVDEAEWTIPNKYQPTEKQKNTLLFINGVLNMNLKPITRRQCWNDINKYFNQAKEINECRKETFETELFGLDEGDYF